MIAFQGLIDMTDFGDKTMVMYFETTKVNKEVLTII